MFKPGDKVKLRDDLVVGREYGVLTFLRGMDEVSGRILTISYTEDDCYCYLKETGYCYTVDMLEPAEEEMEEYPKVKLKKVTLKPLELKKEENTMELLKIYIDRKIKEIKEESGTKKLEIVKDDEIDKKVKALKDELNEQYNGIYVDINVVCYEYTKETKEQLKLVDEQEKAAIKEFDEKMAEVEAQLKLCETYEQKMDILASYSIIDKKTKQLTA